MLDPDAQAKPATDGVRVFASIGSIDDIHDALRDRFEALELSRAAIDAAAGLADGHASKLLAMPPIKRFGDLSLFPTLEAAGLRLALVEDPAAMARAQDTKNARGIRSANVLASAWLKPVAQRFCVS